MIQLGYAIHTLRGCRIATQIAGWCARESVLCWLISMAAQLSCFVYASVTRAPLRQGGLLYWSGFGGVDCNFIKDMSVTFAPFKYGHPARLVVLLLTANV